MKTVRFRVSAIPPPNSWSHPEEPVTFSIVGEVPDAYGYGEAWDALCGFVLGGPSFRWSPQVEIMPDPVEDPA